MIENITQAPVTLALLLLTVGASLLTFNKRDLWARMALEPFAMMRQRETHQLLTSGLIHANGTHLFLNMMTLFFFGPALELTVGHGQFLVIYIVSLVLGSLYPYLKYRNDPQYVAIGASGAISGVVFSFVLFYPMAEIYVYFMPMPAFVYAILYTAYSIYGMRTRLGNIGHEAHLAGAVGGLITTVIVHPDVINRVINVFS